MNGFNNLVVSAFIAIMVTLGVVFVMSIMGISDIGVICIVLTIVILTAIFYSTNKITDKIDELDSSSSHDDIEEDDTDNEV